MKKGYKVIATQHMQSYVTEIVTYETPNGEIRQSLITTGQGKTDTTYASNKHGTEMKPLEHEEDFISWYFGYAFGHHKDWEDERI